MSIDVISWNGHMLDATVYEGHLREDAFKRTATPVVIRAPGAGNRRVREDQQPRALPLEVFLRSGSYATGQDELAEWFSPSSGEGLLVVDDNGTRKQIRAVVVASQQHALGSGVFRADLLAAEPYWRGVDVERTAVTVTVSGQKLTINNPGTAPVDDAVITLRALQHKPAAYGNRYLLESIIDWRTDYPAEAFALEITGGGWNHAAEVAAGRSMASGADIRVLIDGVEVPHWFGEAATTAANQATTTIWANLSHAPKLTATLLTAVTTGSLTATRELEVEAGGTRGWPESGALRLNGEVFTYRGRTTSNRNGREAFTGVTRSRRDTAAASHAVGATLRYVQHRVQIVYGATAGSAAAGRLDVKPVLDLTSATCTNSRHEWLTLADDRYSGRTMQWTRALTAQFVHSASILEMTDGPLTTMQAEFRQLGPVAGRPNFNVWRRPFPTGLVVSATTAYRSVDAGDFAATTSTTRTKPTGVVGDDPLITAIEWNGDPGTITIPAGWTEIASQTSTSYFKVYVRTVADSGEPATYAWSWVNARSGRSVTYGTQNAASAVRVLSQGTNSGTDALPANVTPTLTPCWLVAISAKNAAGGFTPADGFTERSDGGATMGIQISDRYYTGAKNERLTITSDAGPSAAGEYAVLQIPLRGPVRYVKTIADDLALAHLVVDGDGNQTMPGYELGAGTTPAAVVFSYTGAEQTWVVPAGVTSILVDALGSAGTAPISGTPGAGGRVLARLAVTPGETLRIYVGAPGYNGGATGNGTGGGATDIRQGGAALADRKVTAGGGGGASKGAAEAASNGGPGGYPDGSVGGASALANGGDGATTGAGGAGGTSLAGAANGSNGALGVGGAGGTGGAGTDGAGGGGGLYGGGGGAEGFNANTSGGGGGGGSSGVGSGTSEVQYFGGVNTGNGTLTITYNLPTSDGPRAWAPALAVPVYEHGFATLSPIAARAPDGGTITTRLVTATHTDQAFQFQTGKGLSWLASVRLRCDSATGGSLSAKLYTDNGSDQVGTELATSEADGIAAASSPFDVILSFSPNVPLLENTKYWIGFADALAASTDVYAQVVAVPYPRKSKDDANYRTDRTYRFALAVTPDNVQDFDGYARATDGAANGYSSVVAYHDPAGVPGVVLSSRLSRYWFNPCRLFNERTGQSMDIRAVARLGDPLMFYMGTNRAVNAGDEDGTSIFTGVEYSDPANKITIMPGVNTFQLVEPGVAAVSLLIEYAPRWE